MTRKRLNIKEFHYEVHGLMNDGIWTETWFKGKTGDWTAKYSIKKLAKEHFKYYVDLIKEKYSLKDVRLVKVTTIIEEVKDHDD